MTMPPHLMLLCCFITDQNFFFPFNWLVLVLPPPALHRVAACCLGNYGERILFRGSHFLTCWPHNSWVIKPALQNLPNSYLKSCFHRNINRAIIVWQTFVIDVCLNDSTEEILQRKQKLVLTCLCRHSSEYGMTTEPIYWVTTSLQHLLSF